MKKTGFCSGAGSKTLIYKLSVSINYCQYLLSELVTSFITDFTLFLKRLHFQINPVIFYHSCSVSFGTG